MFLIRAEQLENMKLARERAFVARVLPLLREEMPDDVEAFHEPDLRAMLQRRLRDATELEITSEANVYRFLRVMLVLGPSHAQAPLPKWVLALVGREEPENQRTEALCQQATVLLNAGQLPAR